MRKITRKGLRTKLDKLIKKYVKERDFYTCQHCGKKLEGSNCHGSHVIPVSAGLLWAYDPENIITLCFHCHINWWHKNPMEASDWFKDRYPREWKYIQKIKEERKTRPIKDFELQELLDKLTEKLKGMETNL